MRGVRVGSVPPAALAAVALAAGLVAAQPAETPARRFLRTVVGFTPAEMTALDGGQLVAKLLDTREKGEVAAFGALAVNATQDTFFERARDVLTFRRVPEILEMGSFSSPPKLEDLAGLHFPDEDFEALRKCKPGKCDIKLGRTFLDRLAREVDWSAADARPKAERLAKEALVAALKDYQAGGNATLATLVDKTTPKAIAREFDLLFANSPYFVEYVPAFNAHLRDYPKNPLAGIHDVFYWSKGNFGLRPTISIYHVSVLRGPTGALMGQKMLYSTHYFNAGLEFWALTKPPSGSGLHVLLLNRVRLDPPTGMLSGVLLGKVRDGVKTSVVENLKNAKTRVESAAK